MGRGDRERGVVAQSFVAVFLKVCAVGLTFLFSWLLIRQFSPSQAGQMFAVLSGVHILSAFSRVGLDNCVLSRFSRLDHYSARQSDNSVYFWRASLIVFLVSMTVTLLAMLFVGWFGSRGFVGGGESAKSYFLIYGFALIPLVSLSFMVALAFQGIGRVGMLVLAQNGLANALAIVLMPLAGSIRTYLVLYIAAYAVSLGASAYILSKSIPLTCLEVFGQNFVSGVRRLAAEGFPLWFLMLNSVVLQYLPSFLLGFSGEGVEVSGFVVSQRIALTISFVWVGVNSVLSRRLGSAYSSNDRSSVRKESSSANRLVLVAGVPVFGVIVSFSPELLRLFSPELVSYGDVLLTLSFSQLIVLATGSYGHVLLLGGYHQDLKILSACSLVILVVLLLVALKISGAMAVALAILIATVVQCAGGALLVKKRMGFYPVL